MNEKLFEYFKTADSGWYLLKTEFYRLKKNILLSEGAPDGYDIGLAVKNTKLGRKMDERFLLRYKLNGEVFHLSAGAKPEGLGLKETFRIEFDFISTSPRESYKALLMLILFYEPERLDCITRNYGGQQLTEILTKEAVQIQNELAELRGEMSFAKSANG